MHLQLGTCSRTRISQVQNGADPVTEIAHAFCLSFSRGLGEEAPLVLPDLMTPGCPSLFPAWVLCTALARPYKSRSLTPVGPQNVFTE